MKLTKLVEYDSTGLSAMQQAVRDNLSQFEEEIDAASNTVFELGHLVYVQVTGQLGDLSDEEDFGLRQEINKEILSCLAQRTSMNGEGLTESADGLEEPAIEASLNQLEPEIMEAAQAVHKLCRLAHDKVMAQSRNISALPSDRSIGLDVRKAVLARISEEVYEGYTVTPQR